jgi:hypothetical protein
MRRVRSDSAAVSRMPMPRYINNLEQKLELSMLRYHMAELRTTKQCLADGIMKYCMLVKRSCIRH